MPAFWSMHLTVSFVQDCAKKIMLAVFFSAVLLSGTAAGQHTLKSGINEMVGQTVPRDLIFFDEKGEKVSLRQLTDKPAIISLVYFSCGQQMPASAWEPCRDARKNRYKS